MSPTGVDSVMPVTRDNTAQHTSPKDRSDSQKLDLIRQLNIKPNGWTRKNLRPYCKYKVLYGERKYAQKYPDQPFRILDLPAELRNKIYFEYLYFGYIELSPKGDDISGNRRAIKSHVNFYKRTITPRLKLLRVDRKVNLEAASTFYGENEFRFSSLHGHEMLFAFCRTIGKRNTFSLRKIVEHAPWDGYYEEPTFCRDRPAHFNVTSWQNFQGLIRTIGLHEKGHAARKFNIRRTLTRQGGGITHYSVVIPDRFILQQSCDFGIYNIHRSLLSWIKTRSDIRISVINLYSSGSLIQWATEYETQRRHRKNLRDEALARGWGLAGANYNEFGNYELDAESQFWNTSLPDVGVL